MVFCVSVLYLCIGCYFSSLISYCIYLGVFSFVLLRLARYLHLCCLCFGCHIREIIVYYNVMKFSPYIFFYNFIVSNFMFKSFIHFELIFVCGIDKDPPSFCWMWISSFPSSICLGDCPFSLCSVGTLVEDYLIDMQGFISWISVLFHRSVYLSLHLICIYDSTIVFIIIIIITIAL